MDHLNALVSTYATCALDAYQVTNHTATGSSNDLTYYFVGNSVRGGRHGHLGVPNAPWIPYRLHLCGNSFSLYPPLDYFGDGPGSGSAAAGAYLANVSGNTLQAGGYGVLLEYDSSNAFILKNDFGAVAYGGLAFHGVPRTLQSAVVAKNILGQGVSYHVNLPCQDGFNYFLLRNTYKYSNTVVNPFLNAAASPVHFSQ